MRHQSTPLLQEPKTFYQTGVTDSKPSDKNRCPQFLTPRTLSDECHGMLFSMIVTGSLLSFLAFSNCSCEHTHNQTITNHSTSNHTITPVEPNGRPILISLAILYLLIPCYVYAQMQAQKACYSSDSTPSQLSV